MDLTGLVRGKRKVGEETKPDGQADAKKVREDDAGLS